MESVKKNQTMEKTISAWFFFVNYHKKNLLAEKLRLKIRKVIYSVYFC